MHYIFTLAITLLLAGTSLFANNIQVSNVVIDESSLKESFDGRGDLKGYLITFNYDLSWENSWRLDIGPSNWDGAYVHARYRANGGEWKHLGNTLSGNKTGFNSAGFSENGSLIYRDAPGGGDVNLTGVIYRGLIDDPDFDVNSDLEIRVFAVEMVWVPENDFEIGQGFYPNGQISNGFLKNNGAGGQPSAYTVRSENEIDDIGQTDELQIDVDNANAGANSGTIPAAHPKGFAGFWMMKYEVSQQQYVDFWNSLNPAERFANDPTGVTGKNSNVAQNRNGVRVDNEVMSTTFPDVAMSFVNARMMMAYLDWAGLRPMTEFEYTKASRGTLPAAMNEYAWGTNDIASSLYNFASPGTPNETFTGLSTQPGTGNAVYSGTSQIGGPGRAGIIAGSAPTPGRVQAGASYYGIMGLSGNVGELMITTGGLDGRGFQDQRGDYEIGGFLDPENPTSWPADDSFGFAIRGGGYNGLDIELRTTNRSRGAVKHENGTANVGFRGAVRAGYNSVF